MSDDKLWEEFSETVESYEYLSPEETKKKVDAIRQEDTENPIYKLYDSKGKQLDIICRDSPVIVCPFCAYDYGSIKIMTDNEEHIEYESHEFVDFFRHTDAGYHFSLECGCEECSDVFLNSTTNLVTVIPVHGTLTTEGHQKLQRIGLMELARFDKKMVDLPKGVVVRLDSLDKEDLFVFRENLVTIYVYKGDPEYKEDHRLCEDYVRGFTLELSGSSEVLKILTKDIPEDNEDFSLLGFPEVQKGREMFKVFNRHTKDK
jgi:hypothetical protein